MILAEMRWNVEWVLFLIVCLNQCILSFNRMKNSDTEKMNIIGDRLFCSRFLLHSYDNKKKKLNESTEIHFTQIAFAHLHKQVKLYTERIRLLWYWSHISSGSIRRKIEFSRSFSLSYISFFWHL